MSELEILISTIQQRPVLWDKRNKSYHNRLLSHREWEKVGEIMGMTSEITKKKWRHLRDTFCREIKKLKPHLGADGDSGPQYTGTWPYFEPMKFLKVVVKPRKTAGNIQKYSPSTSRQPATKQRRNFKKINADEEFQDAYLQIERKKIEFLQKEQLDDQDEDIFWFKSILPHLRKLPPLEKLRFRTQMQEYLITELSKIDAFEHKSECMSEGEL